MNLALSMKGPETFYYVYNHTLLDDLTIEGKTLSPMNYQAITKETAGVLFDLVSDEQCFLIIIKRVDGHDQANRESAVRVHALPRIIRDAFCQETTDLREDDYIEFTIEGQ